MKFKNIKIIPMNSLRILFLVIFVSLWMPKIMAQPQDVLVDMCANRAGEDATYLKDFVVQLSAAGAGEKEPVAKFSMVLSKATLYRFSICNSEDSDGEGIIRLFDTERLIASSYIESTGKVFNQFDFECQKTGVYHVFISFKDGKAGSAIGILSFVKKL